jgi:hypothetical protein
MTAVVQPAVTGGGSGGGVPDARNGHGDASGLAPAATATLVSLTGTRKIRGFNVHGETDGLAWIELNGAPLPGLVARFSRVLPAYIVLPNPEPVGLFDTVALKVRNDGSAAGDFEGVFFGE